KRSTDDVYVQALKQFTPDEIAEAFAATRGVTSPSQLRSLMRSKGRNLIEDFRDLAPPRAPIKVSRWSVRRIALTVAVVIAFVILLSTTIGLLQTTRLL